MSSVTVQLPQFEGPLDLLLYLIRKEEMDIMDIPIHKITSQYLEFIKLMKELDLEVAGEFVAMAATLIQIKSRMLLPQYDENGEIVENEDPRKELVQRLLEYQKYQEAARALYERPLLGRDLWARGMRARLEAPADEVVLEDNPVFSLITAYRRVVKSAKNKIHKVAAKLQSIAQRILEIRHRLIVGQKVPMSELVNSDPEGRGRQILITFLSLLELGKMGFVSLFQTDAYQEIYVEARKTIEAEALSQVEEYGSMSAGAVANLVEPEKVSSLDDDWSNEPVSVAALESEQLLLEPMLNAEEMASDEEIAAAERELEEGVGYV